MICNGLTDRAPCAQRYNCARFDLLKANHSLFVATRDRPNYCRWWAERVGVNVPGDKSSAGR